MAPRVAEGLGRDGVCIHPNTPYIKLANSRLKVVAYDLRSPSMLHGKKGFDRLVYAARKVLNQPLTWLFCDNNEPSMSPSPTFSEKHGSSDSI